MLDVVFVGGKVGGQFGNQQFTMRNLTFSNCRTAISHLFDWGWTYAGITMSNCSTAIDITSPNGNGGLNVNSITLIDSDISNTAIFIKTGRTNVSQPVTANSLALENIRLTNMGIAIQGPNNTTLLKGTAKKTTIQGYVAGHAYTPTGPSTIAGPRTPFKRPESLVTRNRDFYTRSKPQYETVPV
jgi:glucan 1,3-beta-glucosidase